MRWEKIAGLVLVAVALFVFFPTWMESLYGRFIAPYIYDMSPALYGTGNSKGIIFAWCGVLAVIGGTMFFKK